MSFFSEYKQVTALLQQKQQIVFYAESRHYYPYYERLIRDILSSGKADICYITSDSNDPLLTQAPAGIKVIYVKWLLGFLFSRLRASAMIMTMPDLGNFLFKRSPQVDSYIYMFHAAVSTHQQYRQKAFYNYDCIFCTGEYQEQEIRKAESLHGLQPKEIIHYGYPLLDAIKEKVAKRGHSSGFILVAPSWFDGCIFDTCLEELVKKLSVQPKPVIIRSHPEYEKRKKKEFRKIKNLIASYPHIRLDDKPNILDSLPTADILITDRSGIAFEFAFGAGKPVLFIDTKLKQTNPDWEELDIVPVENSMRHELGISILPAELDKLDSVLKELANRRESFTLKMESLARTTFYNGEENYKQGLGYVLAKLKKD